MMVHAGTCTSYWVGGGRLRRGASRGGPASDAPGYARLCIIVFLLSTFTNVERVIFCRALSGYNSHVAVDVRRQKLLVIMQYNQRHFYQRLQQRQLQHPLEGERCQHLAITVLDNPPTCHCITG